MKVGNSDLRYEVIEGWGDFPSDWNILDITGVAVDSHDRVFTFSRSEHPVCMFSPEGRFLGSWGEGVFKRPHGIFIAPDDSVYCVGDWDHSVRKFTPDGKLLLTIERSKESGSNGFQWNDPATIKRVLPPFHFPTDAALSRHGDLYVSDGYGNAQVHVFSPDGQLRFSWGEPGTGPGQFMTVHDVCVHSEGRVYIADRENSRIQIFSPEGKFITQWTDVQRPNMMALDSKGSIYVTEMGRKLGGSNTTPELNGPQARVTVRDLSGKVLAQWGAADPEGKDLYFAPHGIAVDSRGDVYVSEVSGTFSRGKASAERSVLHKYLRL